MNDTVLVRVVQRLGGLPRDSESLFEWRLGLAPESLPQGLALRIGHGEPELASRFAGVVHREDVRVLEAGGEANLALEPLGPERGGQLRAEDFQRDQAVVLEVASEVDRRHAP